MEGNKKLQEALNHRSFCHTPNAILSSFPWLLPSLTAVAPWGWEQGGGQWAGGSPIAGRTPWPNFGSQKAQLCREQPWGGCVMLQGGCLLRCAVLLPAPGGKGYLELSNPGAFLTRGGLWRILFGSACGRSSPGMPAQPQALMDRGKARAEGRWLVQVK